MTTMTRRPPNCDRRPAIRRLRALAPVGASVLLSIVATSTAFATSAERGERVTLQRPASLSVPATQTPKWSLCGAGKYELVAGGQPIGSETFDIACRPDGRYSATGRTQISAGPTSLDLTTVLELGADLLPTAASAKGSVGGQPFEQSGTFANGTATLSTNGSSQSMAYAPGSSWMGGNIFYPLAFIVARYDEAKGGVQQFPVFPTLSAIVERVAADDVPA